MKTEGAPKSIKFSCHVMVTIIKYFLNAILPQNVTKSVSNKVYRREMHSMLETAGVSSVESCLRSVSSVESCLTGVSTEVMSF